MRNYRIFALLLTLCLLLPTLFGCAPGRTPAPAETTGETVAKTTAETTAEATTKAPPVYSAHSVLDERQNIKLIGRSQFSYGNILADWTASGIQFEYRGSGDLAIDVEKSGGTKSVVLIATVDGEDHVVTVNKNGDATYPIVSDLPQGRHRVLIRRRTMAEDGNNPPVGLMLQFKNIWLCGTFRPKPADAAYKIAFLGDSITCGVGIEKSPHGLATYAVDLCDREGFDYDVCSVSGIGASHSTSRHGENSMTKYYPYYNYYRSESIRYTPERKADLVIVNLNTNDNNTHATETTYKADLKTLLTEIRAAHGQNVKIVWVVGQMISKTANVNKWLNAVFDELGGESAGLYRIEVEKNTEGESSHPDLSSHKAVSLALSRFLREKNLLDLPEQIPQ